MNPYNGPPYEDRSTMITHTTPILVFRMGKVGSTLSYRARLALGYKMYHVHQLNPECDGSRHTER